VSLTSQGEGERGEGERSVLAEYQSPSIVKSKRRTSVKMPGVLQRAVSTPSIRGQAAAEFASVSTDKKRNKLSYHRTAVACG
jgi:hypothetical protein